MTQNPNCELKGESVIFEGDIWIISRVNILPNARIGKGVVVAPHALVTNKMVPFSIVEGGPVIVFEETTKD